MRRLALSFIIASGCTHPMSTPVQWPALDAQLLADSAATFNFRLGTPTPLAVTPDGAVLFRRTPPREFVADLYELDTKTGTEQRLVSVAELLGTGTEQLSDAEKARRERSRTATKGVVDIDVSDDGRIVLVPLAGMLYLIDRTTGARQVIDPAGDAYDPHLSPDGSQIAFVRSGDLWIASTAGTRRLTKHPEGLEYGVAEFVAQEELGRRRGFWWSPDSKSIAFQRTDARTVDTIFVADARHPEQPPVPFKYPRAGTNNAIVDLGVVSATGGEPVWTAWDLAKYPYLARVTWPDHGPPTIVVLSREQTDLAVIALEGGKPRVLLTEHDDAWLNVGASSTIREAFEEPGSPRWLADGNFLWATESRGDWTLELRAGDGKLIRAITTPEFGMRALVGFDDATSSALVLAQTDPTLQDIWRVPLDGTPPVRLTDGDGYAEGGIEHGVVVATARLRAGGKHTFAIAGNARHELRSVAERPKLEPTTELTTVELGGRKHYVAITRPRAFDRNRRYPVLLKVYGGPHALMVDAARDSYVMDQWYADAGFIVVRTDNRGTPNRGRAWERAVVGDLLTIPLEDQIGALQAVAARYRELDISRTGIFGWSFGGYVSLLGLLLRPDIFKAAVAGAPVTDWSLYDTAYTERYMRMPAHNPEGYKRTSALTHAAKLERPLLVIHGITDDNVHFANTLALIEALFVASKRAEVITLSSTHMLPDPKLSFAREQVQVDFFRAHLGT
ncbi:MAG: Dipeptidyl peptidase [Myxococcales bacterium]|nr:Dipeptidyl peptidase [Myxococcales bacterium]